MRQRHNLHRRRTNHLKSDGKGSLRSAVSAVWGNSALESLIDVDMALAVEVDKGMAKREGLDITLVGMTSRGDLRLTFAVRSKKIRVEGLISAASFGSGRTNSDRQYYYLNGRPFVATKVCTMIFHQLPRINFGTWFNLRLLERSTSCTNPITPTNLHLSCSTFRPRWTQLT